MSKEYLTTSEAAEILRVSERMVRKLCDERKITHSKIGRNIKIEKSDLEEYLKSIKIEKEI